MAKAKQKTTDELTAAGFTQSDDGTWWDGEHEINPKTGNRIRRIEASKCFVVCSAADDDAKVTLTAFCDAIKAGTISVGEGVREKDAATLLSDFMEGKIHGYFPVMVK